VRLGPGAYDLRLNGRAVDDRILAPEWTEAGKRIQYQVYDVTKLVQPDENMLAALVADGWYIGMHALKGRRRALIVRLHLEYADGRRDAVVSDGSWQATLDGPLRHADLFDGERYDARAEQPGWDRPGAAGAAWARPHR
jgi:alpha-L-rhamnosidase